MRILCVTSPFSGVGYHRQMLPFQEMADVYVLFTDFLNDEVLSRGFDIVHVNRFVPGVTIEEMLAFRKKYDYRLVVDIDDYWQLDPWHILYANFPTGAIIQHILEADLVTVTHEYLRTRVLPLNERVEILPNALPYGRGQFHAEKVAHEDMSEKVDRAAVRFVYAGGVTHQRDVALLKGPMRRVASDRWLSKKMHMVLCGYDVSNPRLTPVWHGMINDYLAGFDVPGYVRGPLPPTDYMAFYCEADATMAPLVPSVFNSCKSNLKVLEAGAKKIPIIVSNVAPYDACPYAIKVNKQADWYREIKRIVNEPNLRHDAGEENHNWCILHHHLDRWNEVRRQMFEYLIK